jgi:hypothetical protein
MTLSPAVFGVCLPPSPISSSSRIRHHSEAQPMKTKTVFFTKYWDTKGIQAIEVQDGTATRSGGKPNIARTWSRSDCGITHCSSLPMRSQPWNVHASASNS